MYEIEYEFREEDLIHFNELQLKNNPEMQKNIRKNRIFVPAVMLFIGLFYYVYYANFMTTVYITLLAIAWAIISPYTMRVDMRRQMLDNYTESEKEGMFGKHILSIEPDHLAEQSPGGKHKSAWKDMLRVEEESKYIFIYVDVTSAIIIPKDTVRKGDLDKFSKQAESMIERLG